MHVHGSTIIAIHPEVFRVSYFPKGTEVSLLASSSKDNTRVELVEADIVSYGFRVKWIDKLNFHLLTSDTG